MDIREGIINKVSKKELQEYQVPDKSLDKEVAITSILSQALFAQLSSQLNIDYECRKWDASNHSLFSSGCIYIFVR
jgi:hypothetical protein